MSKAPDFEAYRGFPENLEETQEIKVYPKRWLIMLLFSLYAIISFIQFFEYNVIADVITDYYQIPYEAADWTSLICAAVFVVFSIPITHLLDKYGLRKTLVVGVIGTAVGTCIKLGAVNPNRFWLVLLGQAIIAIFQISIFPLITKVAATWFGYNQIAIACGLGCLGLQIGNALSFLIPPTIVFKGEVEEVEEGLYILHIIYASLAVGLVPLILFFFTDKPPTPPSLAKQQSIKNQLTSSTSLWQTIKTLLKIKPFMIFLVIYAVNLAISWPLQILSNQVILSYYPDAAYDVGIIGLLQVILSIFGSMGVSVLLDKFKRFKETCWVVYGGYLTTVGIYVATLDQGIACIYITSTLIGIFMGAIVTMSMEIIMEFSYPLPEGIPATFVYCWMQFLSLGLTYLCGYLLRTINAVWANVMLIIVILVVDLLFFILKFDLKRQAMQESKSNKAGNELKSINS